MAIEDDKTIISGGPVDNPRKVQEKTIIEDKAKPKEPENAAAHQTPQPPVQEKINPSTLKTENQKVAGKDNSVAAGIGGVLAGGIAGVAVGTIYSDEIKEGIDKLENQFIGTEEVIEEPVKEPEAIVEPGTEGPGGTVEPGAEGPGVIVEPSGIGGTDGVIYDPPFDPDPLPMPENEVNQVALEMQDGEGNTYSVNLIDFDGDQVADQFELVENGQLVYQGTPNDFNQLLNGEPGIPEEYPEGGIADGGGTYMPINWQDDFLEDQPIDPMDMDELNTDDIAGDFDIDASDGVEAITLIEDDGTFDTVESEEFVFTDDTEDVILDDEFAVDVSLDDADAYTVALDETDFYDMETPDVYLEESYQDFGDADLFDDMDVNY